MQESKDDLYPSQATIRLKNQGGGVHQQQPPLLMWFVYSQALVVRAYKESSSARAIRR